MAPHASQAHRFVGGPHWKVPCHMFSAPALEAAEGEAPPSLLDTGLGWRVQCLDRCQCPEWSWTQAGSTWTQFLSLSPGKGESRMSSRAQAQRRSGHCPLCTGQARVARAEGNSQHKEECAVAWKGGDHSKGMCCATARARGEHERKQQAGKINSISPRATVLWSQFFSLLPLK